MIIYGASGHAKVIIDIIASQDYESIDFIIDDDRSITSLLNFKVIHDLTQEMVDQKAVIAIGNNLTRKKVAKKVQNSFSEALFHKSAVVSENTEIGNATVIMPKAVVNSSSRIGTHCIINTGSVIEHDVLIDDYVHISPSATVTGNVEIGEGSHIGAGATIIPGIKIGKWVTIGAGAVIINDIPDFAVVVGSPGKVIKFNTIKK